MLGTGENKTNEVKVGAGSRCTVNVNEDVGPCLYVSARVTCEGGWIVVERPQYS